MNGGLNEIRLNTTDKDVSQLIKSMPEDEGAYSAHYDQNEDFFIKLDSPLIVPHFPIHHDVRVNRASPEYRESLFRLLEEMSERVPQVLTHLTYFFDPGDILRPAFFQVFKVGDSHYLYLLKLDVKFRTHDAEIIDSGSNDRTPEYRTSKVFLDPVLIPLAEVVDNNGGGPASFLVRQTISSTWIGETGRGYMIQGIWMDHDLTKFFSKLFVPSGRRFYPYYPFICRYRTICHSLVHLSPAGRRRHVPTMHRALQFIVPEMKKIEAALRNDTFSEELEVFRSLKKQVPDYWNEVFGSLKVTRYLNEHDMKEFLVEA